MAVAAAARSAALMLLGAAGAALQTRSASVLPLHPRASPGIRRSVAQRPVRPSASLIHVESELGCAGWRDGHAQRVCSIWSRSLNVDGLLCGVSRWDPWGCCAPACTSQLRTVPTGWLPGGGCCPNHPVAAAVVVATIGLRVWAQLCWWIPALPHSRCLPCPCSRGHPWRRVRACASRFLDCSWLLARVGEQRCTASHLLPAVRQRAGERCHCREEFGGARQHQQIP